MNRFSLPIAFALFLYGCTANPLSSPAKLGEDQYQETLKSQELSRKMSLGLKEVEPPEDMAVTDDDIDPDMAIWKAAQWSRGRKHLVPEVDDDDLNRPALGPVPEPRAASFRNDPPVQPVQPGSEVREPEEDMDEVYHRPVPDLPPRTQPQVEQKQPRGVDYTQPEVDRDELYHRDAPAQDARPQAQVQPKPLGRVAYTRPEEDRDHLYHN